MNHAIPLRCGTLRLRVERTDLPLEQLCGFASRRSRKRGFVFVSKVLGKHYPVRPALMADAQQRLAAKLGDLAGPVVFIGLAETATALGHGVFQAWAEQHGRGDAMYQHTTRYRLPQPIALNFDEAHSHATEHLLYQPSDDAHAAWFQSAPTLVLIDDEMSTGRTLLKLAQAFRNENGALASVHLVCLTDWLGAARRREIASALGVPTCFHSLLEGEYVLDENGAFDPGPIPNAEGSGNCKNRFLSQHHGRLGIGVASTFDPRSKIEAAKVGAGESVLVLGTGEFTYAPFRLALALEKRGNDVHFQSTTRSPLLLDRDIASVREFSDNYHDGIANYLYNVPDRRYDRIFICYETAPLPDDHRLAEAFGATPIFF